MQHSHTLSRTSVAFDDPNLVSSAGLVPVMALAQRACNTWMGFATLLCRLAVARYTTRTPGLARWVQPELLIAYFGSAILA